MAMMMVSQSSRVSLFSKKVGLKRRLASKTDLV